MEASRTEREFEILEAQERLRLAEEAREQQQLIEMLAAMAGVRG